MADRRGVWKCRGAIEVMVGAIAPMGGGVGFGLTIPEDRIVK
ncbi:hypothetical protein [Lyngbya sp. CCY1209]|nr:hypothetical protein [Lyngbya sp. CCY1209]